MPNGNEFCIIIKQLFSKIILFPEKDISDIHAQLYVTTSPTNQFLNKETKGLGNNCVLNS